MCANRLRLTNVSQIRLLEDALKMNLDHVKLEDQQKESVRRHCQVHAQRPALACSPSARGRGRMAPLFRQFPLSEFVHRGYYIRSRGAPEVQV